MPTPGKSFRRTIWLSGVSVLLALTVAWLQGQAGSTSGSGASDAKQTQDNSIPDAPSTVQPAKPLPTLPAGSAQPNQTPPGESAPAPEDNPGAEDKQPTDSTASPQPTTPPAQKPGEKQPPINIRTVPPGGATQPNDEGVEGESFKLPPVVVNQVMLPVTVTDENGRLVSGLTFKDFTVLEDGQKQKLNFFSSSAFAVSAAVLVDFGMKDVDLQKVNHTFPALEGAFSEFDELSVFTYSSTVTQQTGWGAVGPALTARLEELSELRGQNNGPPVVSGPIAAGGPVINGIPVDPGSPRPMAATQPARVLNDAILKAALELARRDRDRRKIIFVLSDGREYRSDASYRDVLRVLLTNNIIVYAVGVGTTSVPGYSKLSKLHLPRFGYTDILPKYVNATGGQVWDELTRSGVEDAYSAALGYARDQYTMGYLTHAPPSSQYHDLEVLVSRPGCRSSIRPCVNVNARAGYYAAPASR